MAIIPCFICNLAINKTLSWFWIVFVSLLFSFCFTNLPKLITKHRLILLPFLDFLAFCLLIGVCCLYVKGNWFFVTVFSVFTALCMIFIPIYLSRYKVFSKIKKYGDFISIGIDYILLFVTMIIIQSFTIKNGYTEKEWCYKIGMPILSALYIVLNILLCVRFLKVNKLIKSGLILAIIDLLLYLPPTFIKSKNAFIQNEILNDANILKSNFACWRGEYLDNNVHFVIFLTLAFLSIVLFVLGLIKRLRKNR